MSYKQLTDFATKLRQIDGLHLFKIFMKYTSVGYNDINQLFNFLAKHEKENDLRKLEKLWAEFIETGDIKDITHITEETVYCKNGQDDDDDVQFIG